MANKRKDHVALEAAGEVPAIEAARMLRVSVSTLRKWRKQGIGPSWRDVHKKLVAYNRADIETFTASGSVLGLLGRGGRPMALNLAA